MGAGRVLWIVAAAVCLAQTAAGQTGSATLRLEAATVHGRAARLPPAVFWLRPLAAMPDLPPFPTHAPYTLMQRNRMFSPHLLVVPVGASVNFPNADPFFHNVFSLFDGKRFDLGLYESGSSRQVTFGREGVSYIFCNIHPEMSAVVLALHTPFWTSITGADGALHLDHLPPGAYEAHLWVEGGDPAVLERWAHRVQIVAGAPVSAGNFAVDPRATPAPHLNKFGQPYGKDVSPY